MWNVIPQFLHPQVNMLRTVVSKLAPVTMKPVAIRSFAQVQFAAPAVARAFCASASPGPSDEVVVAEVVDSLEWTLSCPPPIHQFDEPPIVVEISEC
ncbi:unnamed protein product [Choristocarpus tenellus]